ncbi:uncharacterized protein ASPGLDRAFT_26093 [Aspergillus glaucus CBS 516.65]|uniref:Uncharacterized protein n=1 Tax=Aspergillus glaucus CBS 516.65 TaxID=1160497 RepID=A0A1L9VJ04_ASPGL|nr:hypothetical protein ASPGLDRAFT_26093 [Aspergillus glaucus CBS 516.65]OJJ83907.1 hypothetical protein ASPGLDRAFT_26093 [Aspergillus glaucus CBS 516.65]
MTSTASLGPMPQIPIPPTNPNTTTTINNTNLLTPLTNWKSLNQTTYGSRHIHDPAPFTLWNPSTKSFRNPTNRELSYLSTLYNAKQLDLSYPIITIVTDTIPDPVPLTIACVAVRFVRSDEVGLFREGVETNAAAYADEGLPDPVGFRLRMWKAPTEGQVGGIVSALSGVGGGGANVKAITWAGPWCFVELVTGDGRVYGKGSLPGVIAGRTVAYHHSEKELFEDVRDKASLRDLKDSNQTRENQGLHLGGVLGNSITRLVRSNEVVDGAWCSANSLSTGKVFFQCIGIRAVMRDSDSSRSRRRSLEGGYEIERVFSVFNPSRGHKIQNLRGVPMVEESSLLERYKGGGVFGFFRDGDYDMAFCTVLDDIVDAGWELY